MIKKLFLLFVFLMGLTVCVKSQDYLGDYIEEALNYHHYGLAYKFSSVSRVLDLLYNDKTIEEAKVRTISQINGTFHRLVCIDGQFKLDNKFSSMVISAGKMKWTNSFVDDFGALKQGNILTYSSKFSTPNLANYGVSQHKSELLRFDNYCVVLLNNDTGHKNVWFTEEGVAKFVSDFEKLTKQLIKEEEIWEAQEEARRRDERWKELMSFSVSSRDKDLQEIVYGDNRCLYLLNGNLQKLDTYWKDSTKVVESERGKFIVQFSENNDYILIENTNTGERYLCRFKIDFRGVVDRLEPYRISSDVERYDDVFEVVEARKKKVASCYRHIIHSKVRISTNAWTGQKNVVVLSDVKISSINVEGAKIIATAKKVQIPEIEILWKIQTKEIDNDIVYLSKTEDAGFVVFSFPTGSIYVLFNKDFVIQVKDEEGKRIMNALDNYLKK